LKTADLSHTKQNCPAAHYKVIFVA